MRILQQVVLHKNLCEKEFDAEKAVEGGRVALCAVSRHEKQKCWIMAFFL